jgi:putative oxidoreductase
MKNPLNSPVATSFGLLLVRIPLGILFITAGWNKIHGGVGAFVSFASPHLPDFMPNYLGKTYLYLFPFFELGMGLLVLLGLWTRLAAFILSLMLISIIWAFSGIHDKVFPYHPNVMFLAVAILLFLAGGGTFTIDRIIKAGSSGKKSSART